MRTTALAIMACLLGMAAGSGPDTLWVRRLDLGSDENGYGIASRGNAIAAAGSAWVNSSNDILVVRLNQDGDTVWTRTSDGGADDAAISACLDAESNTLVAGYGYAFKGSHPSGRSRLPVFDLVRNTPSADQQTRALTAKYDSLGELKWLRSDSSHLAIGIAADSAGNCYVSGVNVTSAAYDLWLAKLNPSGDTVWTRTFDFAPLEIGYRLALCASGDIAACAYVGDFENFDCLTLKLTPDGDTIWTRRYDRGTDDACCGVAVDPNGNIVVVGRTVKDSLSDALVLKYDSGGVLLWDEAYDFSPDDGVIGVTSDSSGDIYAAGYTEADYVHDCLTIKLDSTGNMLWSTTYGGSGADEAGDVACDAAGNPIIAGSVTDSITSSYDLLVAKYSALTGVAEPYLPDATPIRATSTITAAPDLVLSVPCSGHYDIKLCDLTGRTRQSVFSGHLNQGAYRFSLAGQPAGACFLRVAAPGRGISCQRLVLVK